MRPSLAQACGALYAHHGLMLAACWTASMQGLPEGQVYSHCKDCSMPRTGCSWSLHPPSTCPSSSVPLMLAVQQHTPGKGWMQLSYSWALTGPAAHRAQQKAQRRPARSRHNQPHHFQVLNWTLNPESLPPSPTAGGQCRLACARGCPSPRESGAAQAPQLACSVTAEGSKAYQVTLGTGHSSSSSTTLCGVLSRRPAACELAGGCAGMGEQPGNLSELQNAVWQ